MKRLNYAELERLDTFVHRDLKAPLRLVKFLTGKTFVELTNEALEQYLPCMLEIVHDQMLNEPNNPNNSPMLQRQVRELLEKFGRL